MPSLTRTRALSHPRMFCVLSDMNATRNRRSSARRASPDEKNEDVSSRDAADDADDNRSEFPLDAMRRSAQEGETTIRAFHDACRAHMVRRWRSLCHDPELGRYFDRHDAEANAADAFSSLVLAYGELLEGADKVTGAVNRTIKRQYIDTGRKISRRVRASSLDEPRNVELAAPAIGDPDQVEEMADLRAIAYPAIAALREESRSDPQCAFHLKGCPHADLVVAVLDLHLKFPAVEPYWMLGEQGRQLGYSRGDHSTQEHLDCCYEWRQYRVFAGTTVDPPDGSADEDPARDWLRWPILARFQITKKGAWNPRVVRLESARHILRTDERFGALLRRHKPEVCKFLEGGVR